MSDTLKYNYEKDFEIGVEMPECVGDNDFKIVFYTKGEKEYVANRESKKYSKNISKVGSNKYIVVLRKHGLSCGVLRLRAYYWERNAFSPDGVMQEVISARDTGIELWEGDTLREDDIQISIGGNTELSGVSIAGIITTYQASNSGVIIPNGEWLTTPPLNAKGKYVWSRMEIILTDSTSKYHYSVAYQGNDSGGGSSVDLSELIETDERLAKEIAKKQDKLTEGNGIKISDDGVISSECDMSEVVTFDDLENELAMYYTKSEADDEFAIIIK